MPTLTLTQEFGGLGSYEEFLQSTIEKSEDENLFKGDAQPPKPVPTSTGENLTLGFGYDVTSRRSHPEKVLADLGKADIQLDNKQRAAILYYGGVDKAAIEKHLSVHGTPVSQDERDFIQDLGDYDRSAEGLRVRLKDVVVTKTQGEALLRLVLREKERALDKFLDNRKNAIPEDVRHQLKQRSDQRAVLVDMFYQSGKLVGPKLMEALATGDMVAAAVEIAFLSNATPKETGGIDVRNFTRAEAFLGGTLAPRTPEEAKAVLRAMGERYPSIAQALVNRQGRPDLVENYRKRLERLMNESLKALGSRGSLELQPDGEFAVREPINRAALADALGVSQLGLTLLTRMAPDAPLDMQVLRPGDRLQLPGSGDQLALLSAGAGLSADWPNGFFEMKRLYERFQAAREALAAPRAVGHLNFFWETYYEPLFWADARFQRRRDFDVDFSWPPPGSSRPGLGRRSDADDLSDAEIEVLERMVAEFQDKLDRLERTLEVLRDTPIKVTSNGRWVGTG